jgi:hypothetical protein
MRSTPNTEINLILNYYPETAPHSFLSLTYVLKVMSHWDIPVFPPTFITTHSPCKVKTCPEVHISLGYLYRTIVLDKRDYLKYLLAKESHPLAKFVGIQVE